MPRSSQIIPTYLHPHIETYINDNTLFTEETAAADEGVRFISVFMSPKGRDGQIISMASKSDYIAEFGQPNYEKYGQPGYMPVAILSQTNTKVWCMRIMPPDATYSNIVILAKVKPGTPADGENPMVPTTVMFEKASAASVSSEDDFKTKMAALASANEDPDIDGFIKYPIIGFMCQGRGTYGDKFRVRFTPSLASNDENGYVNYRLEVYNSESSLTLAETFTGSLDIDAVYSNNSLFIQDLVNDPESGSSKINAIINTGSLTSVYNHYAAVVGEDAVGYDKFDLFQNMTSGGNVVYKVETEAGATSAKPIDIGLAEAHSLLGGSNGIFDNLSDSVARSTAIETAYTKAYEGKTDPRILSKRATPAEFILDANYPGDVKDAIISLIATRSDAFGSIDAGIITTATEAKNWSDTMKTKGDFLFEKTCQHYKIRDPYTGKIVPMTTTYHFASNIASHIDSFGNNTPFVGKDFARITGHIKNTLLPSVDADDLELKEYLYNNRINYYETLDENVFAKGAQGTSQNVWSDLSEISNVLVVLEMKRMLETAVQSKLYSFAEAEDRQKFTEMGNRMFANYKGTKVRDFTISFEMNPWEEERSILHCYLGVTFRTIAKRGIIEIDINKRV
ncbi:MAG: hypothetical protein PHF63_00415 [Herbinix sp.]|nr:hypothetical protein [Herbinix sp.]